MTEYYVPPYEALSRIEAEDMMLNLPTAFSDPDVPEALLVALSELLADAFAKGIEQGFALSDFSGQDPGTALDAYNAGIVQGRLEERGDI